MLFGAGDFLHVDGHGAFEVADGVGRHDLHGDHAGPQLGGQLQRCVDGFLREFGTVGGDEDALVHGELLVLCELRIVRASPFALIRIKA
jgi:hypothetical protein